MERRGSLDQDAQSGWRALVVRLGRGRTVLLITLFSMLLSVALAGAIWHLFDFPLPAPMRMWAMAALMPVVIAPAASFVFVTLVLELEHARASVLDMALRDSLTNAYNRRYLIDRLERERQRAVRTGQPLSLLMIDIDAFKAVNDRHGHAAGDLALQAVAKVCEGAMRQYDLLARYGGEEFVVLLPNTSLEQACLVAERVRAAVAATGIPALEGVSVTISLGVSQLDFAERDATPLLTRADQALYAAKRGGRNRWAC